jgi:hypothetical protein
MQFEALAWLKTKEISVTVFVPVPDVSEGVMAHKPQYIHCF